MNLHDLEERLSALSLTGASENYTRTGHQLLEPRITAPRNLWAVRLNYALTFTLLLSLGFNLLQLLHSPATNSSVSSQCEINSTLPDSVSLPRQIPGNTALQETRERLPENTLHLC